MRHGGAFLILVAVFDAPAAAQSLSMSAPYSDHMVFQRDHLIPIAGLATPGATVSIALSGSLPVTVVADRAGRWEGAFPARGAARDLELSVTSSGAAVTLKDVAIGDVFLCSGQSNMEFPLRLATDADNAIANSDNGDLRLLNVPRNSAIAASTTFARPASWRRAMPDSTRDFSAACYFMGVDLQRRRKVPVGLIAASWGGSFIQAWLDRRSLAKHPSYSEQLALLDRAANDRAGAERALNASLDLYARAALRKPSSAEAADLSRGWEEWSRDGRTFDGVGLYRTSIRLNADQSRRVRNIQLGTIDDIDLTTINGKAVGTTVGWNVDRTYTVAPAIMRPGVNRIEIRVIDTGGGGGPYGRGPRQLVLDDGSAIPLDGPWTFQRGLSIAQAGALPRRPWGDSDGLTTLSNGMIAPLGRTPLAGIAWYQGESNASDAVAYEALLKNLIAEWRARFDTRRFAIVQLANFGRHRSAPGESNWAQLREAQRRVAASDPDAALAVAIDVGDPSDIHPADKKSVGQRLALAMEGDDDAEPPIVLMTADRMLLTFRRGLAVIGANRPIGFELCDATVCRFVDATMAGPNGVTVEARSSDRTLRYLWADSPVTNLFYTDGRPVPPFEMALPER